VNPEVLATLVGLLAMILFVLVCYIIEAVWNRRR
jgi:hypothetical protein